MSVFPRSYFAPESSSFTPLFRLLDDFDSYNREVNPHGSNQSGNRQGQRQLARTFTPKFDVKETENAYELHGELPGVEKDKISIEFTESQNIVICGRVERTYTAGTPPSGLIDDGQKDGEKPKTHKATVADEEAEKTREAGSSTEVTKHDSNGRQEPQKLAEKYWVSERSVGEFSRTFSFPSRVDQDGVSANLTNGVLSVTVPKLKKHESKRIAIQ